MKILVLELARLGDIYQTWPALRALRRAHPEAQIEVLTRARFQVALNGLDVISKIRLLPTQDLIAPLLETQMDVKTAHECISKFVDELKAEKYDWILNFSFSPFSSYLTHTISHETTRVSGYSRTTDGFLSIPDDMSAYFYAQVGVNRPNRYHLAEIFATMIGVDLIAADWQGPQNLVADVKPVPEVLIHVGASDGKKLISPIKWATIINQFMKITDVQIGLIGVTAESAIAEQIVSSVAEGRVQNFVGQTDLKQLFAMIQKARLVVGADSAPMHMASLTGTPCVNLSLASVNFWETGPRARGSAVLRGTDETEFASDKVAMVMKKALNGEKQELSVAVVQDGTPSYWCLEPKNADFQWNFLRAIYMSEDFPANDTELFRDGIIRMTDINLLMIEQMEAVQKGTDLSKVASIMDRGEEIIQTIGQLVPALSPLVRWYQTEKIRIGPDTQEKLLERSLGIQNLLQRVLCLYLDSYGLTIADVQAQQADPQEVKS
ncbi:MAG: glycosyltransferase family 9 protein [Pseudobdellovibrionaceae bacterium]